MADKFKKEPTPPHLLFMPAGGGLTLTPPDQPSLFMPVIQSEPSLIDPEDDAFGEADSFVGQSSPKNACAIPTTLFQSTSINPATDTFMQIDHSVPSRSTNTSTAGHAAFQLVGSKVPPLVPTAHVPLSGSSIGTVPPLPNASGLSGLYRKHGAGRYAQMPSGTYSTSPANLMSMPLAPIPFSPAFKEASLKETPFTNELSLETLPPQPSLGQLPGMGFVQQGVGIYVPVSYHWCFCKNVEGRDIWYPFSVADSLALEDAHRVGDGTNRSVVSTDGGRYDVNVVERLRYSVYWDEDPKSVRRCSWFYKREGDNRYMPYDEHLSIRLEDEYKMAVTSGVWHKPIHCDNGETIVMHNPNVMVHYHPSSQPDEWGNVLGDQMRPRVIKRGVSDFESIDEGESQQVDHLVFMVHGIGSVCDIRFRNIIECVDDFRSISQSLLLSHFGQYLASSRVGRVEYLPIQWHKALHCDATGIDKRLKTITLPSTTKLRHFINDTLMDVLFYTSPTYCQRIADTVGQEINRLYELFLSRNPMFAGACSLAGHSLGSCILFDILQHQADNDRTPENATDFSHNHIKSSAPTSQLKSADVTQIGEPHISDGKDVKEESMMTLEELLTKAGLQDKIEVFQKEQIDLESLILCSEADLKDLGIPMGPRKKLHGILKEELQKKDKRCLEQQKREEVAEQKRIQELAVQKQASHKEEQNDKISFKNVSSTTINYIVGIGGTGHALMQYPKLKFNPVCCFALGSPVGLFLSARGIEVIGEDFRLPTCQKYFNIFHPFDPVAYRLEPLINPTIVNVKPVLIPHHKGRKRLHLELKEGLVRMGTDIKQKIIDSLKSTWASINSFARAHQAEQSLEQQVESEMSSVVRQLEEDERSDTASIAGAEDIYIGQLNDGRRVDYVLQERPIESFNDYMFSLTSHGCYWNSEDTVLLVLKEIYSVHGIYPTTPGAESLSSERARVTSTPMGTSFPGAHSGTLPTAVSQMPSSTYYVPNVEHNQEPLQLYNAVNLPQAGPYQTSLPAGAPPQSGSLAFNVRQTPLFTPAASNGPKPIASSGPPPMKGFVKKS